MSRFTIMLSALLILTHNLNARTITGTVLSDTDSTAVAGATCRLMAPSGFLTGTTTGTSGEFRLETESRAALALEVAMTGFSKTEILIESGSKNIDLGNVYLSEGIALGEVTVSAGIQTDSKGRTVVYPSSSDIKSSPTSISLFQKLPLAGLEANPINRSLSVDGGSPMILINGIPSTIDDLNALQPKDIARIEFSRITPARYADKGNNGLISITLVKRTDGGQVYLWGRSATATAFVDANLQASYHQGPSQFTVNYNPSWRNYQQVYDNVSESYVGDDFKVRLEKHDRAPFNYAYHNIRFKYDYSPDQNTLFSVTFRAMPNSNKSRSIAGTKDSELGEYDNYNISKSSGFSPSVDMFFRRDFNQKNTLELQVVGTLSSNDYRRDNRYVYAGGNEENYVMNVDNRRRSLISEISYTHQFSDNTSLSAGYQNTVSHSTNTYLSSDYKPVLTENNNYVYTRLGQQVGKVYLSLATGAKLFWIENDMNRRHFIRNITTARVSWNINSQWNLQASFQYSPAIPSLSSLTDYPQQVSPYLVSNGNPDLKVAENFRYNLAASYKFKKFSVALNSSYRTVSNCVIDDIRYLGDRLFLSQPVNANSAISFANMLTLSLRDVNGFGASVSADVTYYRYSGTGWKHDLTSFEGGMSLWWNKGPYTISYWRKLPGKYLEGHFVGKFENGDALMFDYKPNKHWTFGASWMYMFDKKGTRYPAWNYSAVNPSSRERYIKNNGNMVVLSVSYSADFGSIFKSARRNLNNSDNGSSLLKL